MQVRLGIDIPGLMRDYRDLYIDRYAVLRELLQNARRTQATRVHLLYDPDNRLLQVCDDGTGVEDFQKLLTLPALESDQDAEDGDSTANVSLVHCLYAASRCLVQSRKARLEFAAAAALARQPLEILPAVERGGTEVQLLDIDLPDLEHRLIELARGFPLPLTYNGETVSRPHAVDTGGFLESPVGRVRLAGRHDGGGVSSFVAYLNGIGVSRPAYGGLGERANVVHLDPRRFRARFPDRTRLVDEDEQFREIEATLRTLWRVLLCKDRRSMPPDELADRYYDAAITWKSLDLFDQVPVLPRFACAEVLGYPYQEPEGMLEFLEPVPRPIHRDEIESGAVTVVALPTPAPANLAHWMYAKARGFLQLTIPISPGHWLRRHVRALERETTTIEIVGETQRFDFFGRGLNGTVVLCDHYAITIGGDRVTISNAGLFHAPRLLIPQGEMSGRMCRQASSYVDDAQRFHDPELQWDLRALGELIRRLRNDGKRQFLRPTR